MKLKYIPIILFAAAAHLHGQVTPNNSLTSPATEAAAPAASTYQLQDVVVDGVKKYTPAQIIRIAGLAKGETIEIPGQKLSTAIRRLWDTNNFSQVQVLVQDVQGDKVILRFHLEDLKTLGQVKFEGKGLSKSKGEKIVKDNKLKPGMTLTPSFINNLKNTIAQEYITKGYSDAKVTITQTPTTDPDMMDWTVKLDRGRRVKIDHIEFTGNEAVSDAKLRKKGFKDTKQKRFSISGILKPSKFIPEKYQKDKRNLVDYYNTLGYRDARVVSDSVYRNAKNNYQIDVDVYEGKKYYIGDINFVGNTTFPTEYLQRVLGYKTGDIYDAVGFNKKVGEDGGKEDDSDIKSLYMNQGYLFSNVTPVEKAVKGDSIDLEVRINEGEKATWNKVTWSGNTTTHDHVIGRALRTKPGNLFSKADIKRTYFDLAGMQFFDPQQVKYDIKPNPQDNTVDVAWSLVEKGSSQVQLQAGYGGNTFIGTLGLTFNNFSLRNFLKFKGFHPIPQGDGQTLAIQAQAGVYFQNYSISFVEPWLYGKRPTAFSVGLNQSLVNQKDMYGTSMKLNIFSANAGLNHLLNWPDNYFSLYTGVQYQSYNFTNYPFQFGNTTEYNGNTKNFNFNFALSRNSAGFDPFFPTQGSNVEFSVKVTPPYSLFQKKDYSTMSPLDKYRLMEFYKVKLKADTYNEIVGKLVLRTSAEMGFMDGYNKQLGAPPFERFYLGGTGLFGQRFDGRELIPLRGYENASTSGATYNNSKDITPLGGGTIYNRFVGELRYPISMNQTAKIWALGFVEGGNTWNSWGAFNPFQLKRSAGFGVRVYMGAFGLIGFDFAYGFDNPIYSNNPSGWQTHFLMNQQL